MAYYYLVSCKCGHVGRDKYIPINFAVIAENGEEAAYCLSQYWDVKGEIEWITQRR